MTLNTYSGLLPYLTVPPRQSVAVSNTVMEIIKPVTLHCGRVWHGYDEYASFEAALKVWLNRPGLGSVYLGGVYQHRHHAQMPYVTSFSSTNKILSTTMPIRNDYYPLLELSQLAPIAVPAESTISIDRDFFNIEPVGSPQYDAFDVELVIVVDE